MAEQVLMNASDLPTGLLGGRVNFTDTAGQEVEGVLRDFQTPTRSTVLVLIQHASTGQSMWHEVYSYDQVLVTL